MKTWKEGYLDLVVKFFTKQRCGAKQKVFAAESCLRQCSERARKASSVAGMSAMDGRLSSSVTLSCVYRKPWCPEL